MKSNFLRHAANLAAALSLAAAFAIPASAAVVPLSFTKLTGLTGGSPAGTAVYKADLSSPLNQ
jgi:hypothetical protein